MGGASRCVFTGTCGSGDGEGRIPLGCPAEAGELPRPDDERGLLLVGQEPALEVVGVDGHAGRTGLGGEHLPPPAGSPKFAQRHGVAT